MRANKEDFELQIKANEIPVDLGFGLASVSIFKGNLVVRFNANSPYGSNGAIIAEFNIESLDESRKKLEKKLTNANFEIKSAQKLIALIVEKILDKMEQAKSENSQTIFEGMDRDNTGKDRTEYIYKYSKLDYKKKKKILYEAAILTSNNNDEQSSIQSVFLYYDKEQDKIKAVPYIVESNHILKPFEEEEYQYIPYAYDMDIDEANLIKDQLKNEKTTLESFYKEGLEFVRLFTVQDKEKQVIIAANVVGSYFQDKFPTCHYLAGYEKKGKTPKINQYTNKPEYFHSFCFKLISAEKIPKEWKTDGVLDRMLHWISQPGIPPYDIKEVLNEESRNAEQQAIFDRIVAFRKKMMIYRLVHFSDPMAKPIL